MEDTLEAFHEEDVAPRLPCPVCQRRFNEDVLMRHVDICETSAKKKRKPFNSQKQRLDGTDVKIGTLKKDAAKKQSNIPKKNNWRLKHDAFLTSIRAARGSNSTETAGNSGHKAPHTSTVNPDYVQCPHCERRFNEHSAQRHIEFCKEQKSRVTTKKAGAQNLTKLAKRTQYKPPLLGKKKSVDSHSAGTPQRQTSSSKYGRNSNYTPSSAEKDSAKQPAVRRTQSSNVGDARKELVFKRRSGSLNTNDGSTNDLQHSPKHTATNGVTSPKTNNPRDDDLFHDDDISRAASGSRRNRRSHAPIASPSKIFNGQTTTPPGIPKKSEQHKFHHDLEDGGSGDDVTGRTIESGRRKGSRHNSPSSISRKESGISVGSGTTGSATKLSRFCYECGTKYPVAHAKYCCECGVKRLHIDL